MLMEVPDSVRGDGPRMATLVEIGGILEHAQDEPPLSLAEIERRMAAKRVRHETLRGSVDFLERLGFVTTGSKGVQWTHRSDDKFWRAAKSGPVSLRVDAEDLQIVTEAGLVPTEIMRAALHAKARALRAENWAKDAATRRLRLAKGAPSSEALLRETRDER